LPWQVVVKEHGRYDFYHPGVKQFRKRHPMIGFWGQLLAFLRENAVTNVPIAELLEAQVFKEASPQVVRERLGFWEGPLEDEQSPGSVYFVNQWKGADEAAIVRVDQRSDDPRLEAAANISYRLAAWLHLWRGFVPEESFPLLEGRMAALVQQVGESVVTAPGMATTQMVAHMQKMLPKLVDPPEEPPPEPERPPTPLTADEEALQPLVTKALGKAYGIAVDIAAKKETEEMLRTGRLRGDSDTYTALLTCCGVYRACQSHVAQLEYQEWLDNQYPAEEEEFEEEYEDEEEFEEEEATSEEEVEDEGEKVIEDPADTEEDEEEDEEPVHEDKEDPLEESDEAERPIPTCKGFLACLEVDLHKWAQSALRPVTPPSGRKSERLGELDPMSPKVPMHRDRRSCEEEVWHVTVFEEPGRDGPGPPPRPALDDSPVPPAEAETDLSGKELADPIEEMPEGDQVADEEGIKEQDSGLGDGPALEQDPGEPSDKGYMYVHSDTLRPKAEAEVNSFTQSLLDATSYFEQKTGDDGELDDDFLGDASWKRTLPQPVDSSKLSTGRGFLERAKLPSGHESNILEDDESSYENVVLGCAARPNSPKTGPMSVPYYLENAKPPPPPAQSGMRAWPVQKGERAKSADGRVERDGAYAQGKKGKPKKGGPVGKPAQAKLSPRPISADPHSRKRPDFLPHKHSAAAEMAAASTKRFLSRTCGTMQAALATFDPSGDGRFSREEWTAGLAQLGFDVGHDIQEIFTVLDRRGHHMLTLSDLLDYCKGVPIETGMPPTGLRGTMSHIFSEVLTEVLDSVAKEALGDIAMEEFLAPRGPHCGLPDVKKLVKEAEKKRKAQEKMDRKQGKQGQGGTTDPAMGSKDSLLTASKSQDGEGDEHLDEFPEDPEARTGSATPKTGKKDGKGGKGPRSPTSTPQSSKGPRRTPSDGRTGSQPSSRQGSRSPGKTPHKATKDEKKESAHATQLADKLRIKLGRDPSDEEVARQKLKDKTGAEPSEQEVKKEAKHLQKLNAAVKVVLALKLRKELGREPKPEEIARRKLQDELGKEPTTDQVNAEAAKQPPASTKPKKKKPRHGVNKMLEAKAKEAFDPNSIKWVDAAHGTSENLHSKLKGRAVDPLSQIHSAKSNKQAKGDMQWQRYEDPRRHKKDAANRGQRMKPSVSAADRYAGYGFALDKDYEDLPEHKLLPFVPRPASEICKTYSHIFRLLSDPRVKKLGAAGHQKRSLHVSMPNSHAMGFESDGGPPLDGGDDGDDAFDSEASKSSPNLTSGASTTAGTWRPHSGGAVPGVSLPPLGGSTSGKERPWVPDVGNRNGIDAEARRSPDSLRAQGSLTGTL